MTMVSGDNMPAEAVPLTNSLGIPVAEGHLPIGLGILMLYKGPHLIQPDTAMVSGQLPAGSHISMVSEKITHRNR